MSINSKSLFCIIFAINSLKIIYCLDKWRRFRKFSRRNIPQNPHMSDKSSDERMKIEIFNLNRIKLTSLPTELLLSILDRVPISDLFGTIPLVCSYFTQLTTTARAKRHSLSLIYGELDVTLCPPFYSPSTFVKPLHRLHTITFPSVDQLNVLQCTRLATAFPRIRSLRIIAHGLTSSQLEDSITQTLLAQWQTQLESLHLTLWFRKENRIINPNRILLTERDQAINAALRRMIKRTINPAPNLRKLALISGQFVVPVPLELSIIGQLSEFYFCCAGQPLSIIQDSLLKYGEPNRKLKYIGLNSKINGEDVLRRIILPVNAEISTFPLTQSITSLSISTIDFAFEQLDSFLLCLPNLCYLAIHWSTDVPLVDLIRALVPLTNSENSKLKTLVLAIYLPDFLDTSQFDLSSLATDENPTQLHSITKLYFKIKSPKHTDYRLFHFDVIFPSLEWFYLLDSRCLCSICGIEIRDYLREDHIYRAKRAGCVKWITTYLRATCPGVEKFIFAYISEPRDIKREIHF